MTIVVVNKIGDDEGVCDRGLDDGNAVVLDDSLLKDIEGDDTGSCKLWVSDGNIDDVSLEVNIEDDTTVV